MNLKIKNFSKIEGIVKAPSSKSYSHRSVIIASLANGTSKLYDVLYSEDVLASINACKSLGAKITEKKDENNVNYLEIVGTGGKLHNLSNTPIDLANSGTTLRIMTSVASLSDNEVTFTGDDSLKTRPMGPLLEALSFLGIKTVSLTNNNKAPLTIKPGFKGGNVNILGNISSQFISSILISSPLSNDGVELCVLPKFVSKPYVDMTISVMEKFGVKIESFDNDLNNDSIDENQFDTKFIIPTQIYQSTNYNVEGDYSSASYLLATCAIAGGQITVQNLFKDSKQGDKLIINILKDMGCKIDIQESYVTIKSDGNLKSLSEIDLSNAPDLLLTVAILAAIAEGETKITGIAHARLKETDRIDTTCRELEKLGCELQEFKDSIIIKGKTIHGGIVNSHKDHRLAMAFSLLGLKENVEVEDGECFDVSFPNFIEAMGEIGVELEFI